MEIFCLGGLILWAFCVVLLAMTSAVGSSLKLAKNNERTLSTKRAMNK